MFIIYSVNEEASENSTIANEGVGHAGDRNNVSSAIGALQASMENRSTAGAAVDKLRFVEMDAPDHWANFDYVRDEPETSENPSTTKTATNIGEEAEKTKGSS